MTQKNETRLPNRLEPGTRKTWRKKTPVETLVEETERLRQEIAIKEEQLQNLRLQLDKFEQARKIFETP